MEPEDEEKQAQGSKVIAEFDKCPYCGSTERFAESVAKEERVNRHMREDYRFCLTFLGGPVTDPQRLQFLLVGTMIPVIRASIDSCQKCGGLYATRHERSDVPLTEQLRQQLAPPIFFRKR